MARTGLATRLYQGEANVNIVGRRRVWFITAAVLVAIAIGSIAIRGFSLGIEFAGGTSFSVPAKTTSGEALTQARVSDAVAKAIHGVAPGAEVDAAQKVGRAGSQDESFSVRASALT